MSSAPALKSPPKAIDNTEAREELRRFLILATDLQKPLTMFSAYIDDAWHELMKDEAAYLEFCQSISGRPIEHVPSGKDNPIVCIEWLKEYEARYGDLNPLWFADIDGNVDSLSYGAYRRTGEIYASWRCSPY